MRTTNTVRSSSARIVSGPAAVPAERRNRRRLRDLCDEVLASYRLAREGELFSAQDREEARKLLSSVAGH